MSTDTKVTRLSYAKVIPEYQAPPDPLAEHHRVFAPEVHAEVDHILDVHTNGPTRQRVCTTGITALDARTGGWMPGQSYVIAGKTGIGKTSFATHSVFTFAAMAAERGLPPALFFSLEMTQRDMAHRAIAWLTGTPQQLVQRAAWEPCLTDDEAHLVSTAKRFTHDKIRTVCTTDASIVTIREHARRVHRQHGLSLVVCDYIGLLEPPPGPRNGTREREVAMASRGLRAMAIELNVPVLVLSQLGRAAEHAEEPYLGLLRESGSIENDASAVLFLWPSKEPPPVDDTGLDVCRHVDIVIAKSRFGTPWGKPVTARFFGATGFFRDLDAPADPEPRREEDDHAF